MFLKTSAEPYCLKCNKMNFFETNNNNKMKKKVNKIVALLKALATIWLNVSFDSYNTIFVPNKKG